MTPIERAAALGLLNPAMREAVIEKAAQIEFDVPPGRTRSREMAEEMALAAFGVRVPAEQRELAL